MVEEFKKQGSEFVRGLSDPKFWWGVMTAMLAIASYAVVAFGSWSRQDEAMRADLRHMAVQIAALTAARQEDDKSTQANALREAEYRARIAGQIDGILRDLNQMARQMGNSSVQRNSSDGQLEELLRRNLWRFNFHFEVPDKSEQEARYTRSRSIAQRVVLWEHYINMGFPIRVPVGE